MDLMNTVNSADTVTIMSRETLPTTRAPKRPKTLQDYAREFLAQYLNPNTRDAYEQDIAHFLSVAGGDLRDEALLVYRAHVIGSSSARTARRRLGVVKSFLDTLVLKEVLPKNLYAHMKKSLCPRVDKNDSPTIHLTDEEVLQMVSYPDTSTILGSSQNLALTLGFYLGLRVSEMNSIKFGDIDGRVLTVIGKGSKKRTMELDDAVLNLISGHKLKRGGSDSDYLLITQKTIGTSMKVHKDTINKWFKDVAAACGIKKHVTSHTGRATVATKLLDEEVPLRDVANLLGHSSLDTTMLYDKLRKTVKQKITGKIRY